jgi:hypothetical protein
LNGRGNNKVSETRMAGIMDAIRKAGGLAGLGLRTSHFGVLIVMADYENEVTGDCWPSCKTIAKESGQNKSWAATLRAEIERKGYIIEIRERRVEKGTMVRKYWRWNEQVFPKVRISQTNTRVQPDQHDRQPDQHELHCTALQEEEEGSKAIDSLTCPPSAGRVGGDEEESQEAPAYEPVGTAVANAPSVPEARSRQEGAVASPKQDRGGPTIPVMLHLLDLLESQLGISHPRTGKEPWPTLETDFQEQFSAEEQKGFLPILDWALTDSPHFRKTFADPLKKDLIRFFVNNAKDMREDFEANRAKAMVSQSPASVEGGAVEEILPAEDEIPAPVENVEPTLPLGQLFLQCLEEKGLTFHDTSTWDGIEKSLPGKYPAALLLEAPNAIRLVLAGEDAYWYGLMFDGKKENQFRFFMNNLPKIVKSLQANRARAQLTPKAKEPSNGSKKSNKYSIMVPD